MATQRTKTKTKTIRAAIYCRISSDRTGQALGVARQRKLCEELAAREGWDVVAKFIDNDRSAYSGKVRPEYVKLLDAIESGSIDALAVWHNDRLHRSPRELNDFIDLIEKRGVLTHAVQTGRYDLSTASGRLNARMLCDVATYESEHKSDRIKARNQQKREAGICVASRAAFGYDSKNRTKLDPVEAPIFLELVERTLAGASLRSMTRWLIDQGVPTHSQKHKLKTQAPWHSSTIKSMLLNPRYAGLLAESAPKPLGWKVIGEGKWDALIDVGTHKRLVKLLTDPARRKNRAARNYLLSGMVRCGRCGESFVSAGRKNADGSQRREMVCRRDPGYPNCGRGKIVAEPLEEFVAAVAVAELGHFAQIIAEATAAAGADNGIDVDARRAELDDASVMLAEAFAEDLSGPALKAGLAKIADQRAELDRQAPAPILIPAPVQTLLDAKNPTAVFEQFDDDGKRIVLKTLIDYVRIDPPTEGRRYVWNDDRVHVEWKH